MRGIVLSFRSLLWNHLPVINYNLFNTLIALNSLISIEHIILTSSFFSLEPKTEVVQKTVPRVICQGYVLDVSHVVAELCTLKAWTQGVQLRHRFASNLNHSSLDGRALFRTHLGGGWGAGGPWGTTWLLFVVGPLFASPALNYNQGVRGITEYSASDNL